MDVRDGIGLSGLASYYLSRGAGPNNIAVTQTNVRSSTVTFQAEDPQVGTVHGINIGTTTSGTGSDPVKRKRGRPRKYGPEGAHMSLALSPMASPGSTTPVPKRSKGRPPGTGWKQQLASVGEWMSNSAGLAFTPFIIQVGVGEDIAAKVLAFAQQKPRALCILSASGAVSSVTLRPPASSGSTISYEGRFEILCMSGSYLVSEHGGPRNRTGGISISVSSPDGLVIGGAIGGRLIAAGAVQVVVFSFVPGNGNLKAKSKVETCTQEYNDSGAQSTERQTNRVISTPNQEQATISAMAVWPPNSRADMRALQTGIDLTRG